MKSEIVKNNKAFNYKKFSFLLGLSFFSLNANISLNAEQIANSSIDLKKDVDNIKQKTFQSKEDLESPINEEIDKGGNSKNRIT